MEVVSATIVIGPPSGLLVVVVAAVGSVGVPPMRLPINRWWHYSDGLDGMLQRLFMIGIEMD